MRIIKLYPQFSQMKDRRQEDKPVAKDRRSGMDRRVNIDSSLRQDLKQVKDSFKAYVPQNSSDFYKQNVVLEGVLNTIPSTRRLVNVEDNKDNNKVKAAGLGLIGLINVKEDIRDLLSLLGRSKAQAPEDFYNKFKFFRGTIVESFLEKFETGQKFLRDTDTTLADTKTGHKIYSLFNIKETLQIYGRETKFPLLENEVTLREYVKHEGTFAGKLACLTLNRVTKLGLIAMSLLELPTIYKSAKDNNDYSQIVRSGINVASCSLCGAFFSSLFTLSTSHPAGSVIGLGLGIFIGNKLSKLICPNKNK